MAVIGVVIIVAALAGAVFWIWALLAGRATPDRSRGPVDVTDRNVMPPAPGSSAATAVDRPGSRPHRATHGKP